jgi:hypothetical protein
MDTRQPFDYSPSHIAFGVEVNEDQSIFSVGTDDGFSLFDTATGKLVYSRGEPEPG